MAKPRQKKATERKQKSPKPAKSSKPEPEAEPKAEAKAEPKAEAKAEPKAEAKAEPKAEVSEKVVYVGQKPVKNYVIACLTSFSTGSNKIVLKARGRAICKAVDTVELLRRTFMKDAQLQGISICTEQVAREGDRKANVSAIEITLTKA